METAKTFVTFSELYAYCPEIRASDRSILSLRGLFTRTANPESTLRPPALVTFHRCEVTSFPGKQPERKVVSFGTRQEWHSGKDS